jgi:hypothetical protein
MTKQEFFKINDKVFLPLGFTKDEEDPLFYYSINLASEEAIEENELEEQDIPKLLYGSTGINSGFCIYTGMHFVWLNIGEASEALEFSKKISAFEAV